MSVFCSVRTRIKIFKDERVERKFFGEGKILVKKGQKVAPDEVIAKIMVGGEPLVFDLPLLLKAKKPFPKRNLIKPINKKVEKGEGLACTKSLFFGKKTLIAPCSGKILALKEETGELIFQPEAKKEVQVPSLFWGEVESVEKDQVVLNTSFQDILGTVGLNQAFGKILICQDQAECFSFLKKKDSLQNQVFVFFESPGRAVLEKLKIRGISGVVCGGVHFRDFEGCQRLELPLLLIEGFGNLKLGEDLFRVFPKYEGREVMLEGKKKRLRIPLKEEEVKGGREGKEVKERELKVGDKVRLVGEPGSIGVQAKVVEIGKRKVVLESNFKAVLVKVRVGQKTLEVPSNNLEIIETQ